MAKGGRPTKITTEVRKKIEEVASLGGTVEEMAYYCDVKKQTIYNLFKAEPEYLDYIDRLRERPVLKARQTIVKSLEQPAQAQWYLTRKKKAEFGDSQTITHELPTPLLHNVLSHDSNTPSDGDAKED